jgi:GNAT superfamily N-acetyltransferase
VSFCAAADRALKRLGRRRAETLRRVTGDPPAGTCGWRVRPAAPRDRDAIARLWNEVDFDEAPTLFRKGMEEVQRGATEADILVAEDGAGVVRGFVFVQVAGDCLLGKFIAVSRAARGRGCGRALILAGHELARARGARTAVCTVWPESGVLPFYEKTGYREIGRVMEAEL